MPSIIHKVPIAEELRKCMLENVRDLMLGGETNSGLLDQLYSLIGQTSGAIELAYRRGYQAGIEAANKGVTDPFEVELSANIE